MITSEAQRWTLPVFDLNAPLGGNAAAPHSTQELDAIEAAAYEEGLKRGHTEGFAAGLAQAASRIERVEQLLAHLARPLAEVNGEAERALVAMTIELARRLAHLEMDLDPTRVGAVVREGLSVLGAAASDIAVHLHPEDADVLRETLALPTGAHLHPDPSLMRGDCVLRSPNASVDARLDTRQAELAQRLLGDAP